MSVIIPTVIDSCLCTFSSCETRWSVSYIGMMGTLLATIHRPYSVTRQKDLGQDHVKRIWTKTKYTSTLAKTTLALVSFSRSYHIHISRGWGLGTRLPQLEHYVQALRHGFIALQSLESSDNII